MPIGRARYLTVGVVLIFVLAIVGVSLSRKGTGSAIVTNSGLDQVSYPNKLKISSPVFNNGQAIPAKYTCTADNVNPPLVFSDVPAEAKSLALVVNDPDSVGGDWFHWLVWNIDPGVVRILENSVPAGAVEGVTSFDTASWGGPCPASGEHRYFFSVYALSEVLPIKGTANWGDLKAAMEGKILDKSEYYGVFSK